MARTTNHPRPPRKTGSSTGPIAQNSEAIDNYLKAIFWLGGSEERRVATHEIAGHLRITTASVTNMLQKLAAMHPPLVTYEKHHGVQLAERGKVRAREVVRHHRLLETFLHDVLGYEWDEVHPEAERLEHFISEKFEERIAAKLGNPQFDPHGHVIPALDGSMPQIEQMTVRQLGPSQRATVVSVSDKDPEMLRHLALQGIRPGTVLTVVEQLPFDGPLRVRIGSSKSEVLLSLPLTQAVSVSRVYGNAGKGSAGKPLRNLRKTEATNR
jgi:DtxR family Mn-dependent transcriptional regulator